MAWRDSILGISGAAAAAAAMLAVFAPGAASAQGARPASIAIAQNSGNPFSSLVGARRERKAARARVERYALASDNRTVLIQMRGRTARVRFLCGADDPRLDCRLDPENAAPEIYLLTVTRGPRGDLIFKNAEGDALVRIASYGGATIFWPGESQGYAASKSFGEEQSLDLAFEDIDVARRRANAATAQISAQIGAPVTFELGDASSVEGANMAVLSDAVMRAAVALHNVARDETGARIVAGRINEVDFQTASASGVRLEGGRLIVSYVPDQDIGGRPSSRAIERFLEDSL